MKRTAFLLTLAATLSISGYTENRETSGIAGAASRAGQPLATFTLATDSAPTLTHPLLSAGQSNPYIREIVHDLIAANLLDHFDQLSFTLDATGLTLNGVQQADAIYRPFRTKYVKHQKDHFIYTQHYNAHGGGTHTEVKIDHFGPTLEK
jgi:hypothetical protein